MNKHNNVLTYTHRGVIEKLVIEEKIPKKEGRKLFKDLLRFLTIAGSGLRCVPSTRIDLAWHTFILFTEDYHSFCRKFFGKMLHHKPFVWNEKPDDKGHVYGERLYAAVQKVFGQDVDATNWLDTAAGSGTCCSGDISYEEEKPLTPEEKIKKEIADLKNSLKGQRESTRYYRELHEQAAEKIRKLEKEKSELAGYLKTGSKLTKEVQSFLKILKKF